MRATIVGFSGSRALLSSTKGAREALDGHADYVLTIDLKIGMLKLSLLLVFIINSFKITTFQYIINNIYYYNNLNSSPQKSIY